MENPLEHALVPVANGQIRSGGVDLIAGEVVKEFWTWTKYIQDIHLNKRSVVMISAAEARVSMAKAAELRAAGQLKEEKAEINGIKAQLNGVTDLLNALDKQRDELITRAEELTAELESMGERVAEKMADEGMRPEDAESDALDAKPQDSIEEATGLRLHDGAEPETSDAPPAPDDEPPAAAVLGHVEVAQIKAWAKGLTYRDLQAMGKKLELKTFGVKQAELQGQVIEAVIARETEAMIARGDTDQAEGDEDDDDSSTDDGEDTDQAEA